MQNTTNNSIKKQSKKIKKNKQIMIKEFGKSCQALLYYEDDKLKKSKIYILSNTPSVKRKIIKIMNKDYKLWKRTLWKNGFLEEDDIQFLNA